MWFRVTVSSATPGVILASDDVHGTVHSVSFLGQGAGNQGLKTGMEQMHSLA